MIPRPALLAVAALLILPALSGCGQSVARGPYAVDGSAKRDIAKAEELYQEALPLLASDAPAAEQLLRDCLGFDLYHGGAHNNLGVLLLGQNRLYDAAEEFTWARKLLPGHPEPRTNLAITLERGGKHQEALDAAHAALEIRPGDLDAMECLAMIQLREGIADATTLVYLDAIILRAHDDAWNDWARSQRPTLEARLQQQ
jgi:tetratricopeptide (TPR) repeat protein